MSKGLKATVYVDDNVTSVKHCRNSADNAEREQKQLKEELWGLIMSTPKDITPNGDDPISYIRERFEDIWSELWDAFVNEYKYTIIGDDAEYDADSLVKKQWDDEIADMERLKKESDEKDRWFAENADVVSKYSFDDHMLYDRIKKGEVQQPVPFTVATKEILLRKIKEDDETLLRTILEKNKNGK